jgi:hypothetical protein
MLVASATGNTGNLLLFPASSSRAAIFNFVCQERCVRQRIQFAHGLDTDPSFSKVSALVHLLYNVTVSTVYRTFENVCRMSLISALLSPGVLAELFSAACLLRAGKEI